jgi:3-methyladenine DNA glycosylase/8-oxoguanine DNA glycosylase
MDRIAKGYPTGETTSGFLALLRSEGAANILNLKAGRKLRTIEELAQFLADRGVENTNDLSMWLQASGNPSSLMTVHGVGPKTVSFLKLLVGLDAIAVDRQILRFVQQASVDLKTPELVEALLTKAGRQLGLTGAQVDQLVWRSLAAHDRRTMRPAT